MLSLSSPRRLFESSPIVELPLVPLLLGVLTAKLCGLVAGKSAALVPFPKDLPLMSRDQRQLSGPPVQNQDPQSSTDGQQKDSAVTQKPCAITAVVFHLWLRRERKRSRTTSKGSVKPS